MTGDLLAENEALKREIEILKTGKAEWMTALGHTCSIDIEEAFRNLRKENKTLKKNINSYHRNIFGDSFVLPYPEAEVP